MPGGGDGGRAGLAEDAEADAGGIAAGDEDAEAETPAALPPVPANFRRIFPRIVRWMWRERKPSGKLPSRMEIRARYGITVACADHISKWLVAAGCVRIVQNGRNAGTYAVGSAEDALKAANDALEGARKG